jgi:hypothetical protein
LDFQQLVEKVVAVLWVVKVGQCRNAFTSKRNTRCRVFPHVKPIKVAAANVGSMGLQSNLGLLQIEGVLD